MCCGSGNECSWNVWYWRCLSRATTAQGIGFEFELLAARAAITTAATAIGMEKSYATGVALLQQKNCFGVRRSLVVVVCMLFK